MRTTTQSFAKIVLIAIGATTSGCDPTCTIDVHANRILARQEGVIDCGVHEGTAGLADAERVANCINDAIRAR